MKRDGTMYKPYLDDFDPCDYLKNNLIFCRKYNYSVPKSFNDYKAAIHLSNDEEIIKIYNAEDSEKNSYIKCDHLTHSIKIKDIKGFIYGSFSTRFWMMRIGVNQLINDHLKFNKMKE